MNKGRPGPEGHLRNSEGGSQRPRNVFYAIHLPLLWPPTHALDQRRRATSTGRHRTITIIIAIATSITPPHQHRVELRQQEDTGHPGAHAQARRDPDGKVERGSRRPRKGERCDEVGIEGLVRVRVSCRLGLVVG